MLPNFQSYERPPAGLVLGPVRGLLLAVGTFIVKRTSWPGHGPVAHLLAGRHQPAAGRLGAVVIDGLPDHWPSIKVIIPTFTPAPFPWRWHRAWFALVKLLPRRSPHSPPSPSRSWPS